MRVSNFGDLWTMQKTIVVVENKTDNIEEDLQLVRMNDKSSNKEELTEEDNSVKEIMMSNTPTVKDEEDPILLTAVTQSTFVDRKLTAQSGITFIAHHLFISVHEI